MKRLLFFICTLLCANVLMAQTTFYVDGLQYQVTSTSPAEVEVNDANTDIATANIPETVTYNETTYDVTSIGGDAFFFCSSLTSVNIPNSVTSIGGYAFARCDSLTSVNIPNSVDTIGEWAFAYCSSLTSVTIPNSVTSIGYGTFEGCSSLTSIDIPNSVTSIGYWAFDGCSSLTSVTIPNSVTSIGYAAFSDCSSLISVTIPNSVTSIGGDAFFFCSSLTSVTCLATNPPYLLGLGVFYDVSDYQTKTLYVPNGCRQAYMNTDWAFPYYFDCIVELDSGATSVNLDVEVNNEEWGDVEVDEGCGTATLTATANEGYIFLNWNDGNTDNPRLVSLTSDTSFVANFIISTVNTDITATICQGQTYTENGFNVSEAGTYTQTLTAINGADSIVTLTVSVNPTFNTELSATICEGQVYNENGFNVSEAGVYTQTLTSANGCDSIVTLSLNVNPIFNTELSANICQGQVYNENGFNVSEAGVYTQNLQTINGCDSIVTLTLNVNPIYNTELSANICQGQIYNENGFNVSEVGVYTQTLQTINGCDSIVTLTLNVNPVFNTELSATICQGQVYNENGFNVSEAGVYTQTLQTVNGCDSIVTLTLNVNPTFNTELSATICQGQVYNENGFNVSEAGVYTQTLTSVNGCDSVVTLTVSVNPTFDTTINATINAGETYAEFGFNESEAGTYVQNLQTEFGCDSTITLVLSVNSSLMDVEHSELSFYPNPTDSKITFSSTIERIEVIDQTGRCVLTFSNAREINIESLPSGAYYLRLTNNDKAIMRKVIKE